MYTYCTVETRGGLSTVTIDRPEKRNALNRAANFELHDVFDRFEADPAQRVAIVTGAGETAFCAGADLRAEPGGDGEEPVPPSGFGGLAARFDRTKPVIAAVNGFAMGGGLEIALACDLIIASDNAVFALPEPRVGLVAGSGGIPRLIRQLGPILANHIILTGRRVPASEAYRLGLVNEVVPAGQLLSAAESLAGEILACSPTALRAVLAVAGAFDGHSVEHSMANMWGLPAVAAVIPSPDAREGRAAFAEKRAPQWAAMAPLCSEGET